MKKNEKRYYHSEVFCTKEKTAYWMEENIYPNYMTKWVNIQNINNSYNPILKRANL